MNKEKTIDEYIKDVWGNDVKKFIINSHAEAYIHRLERENQQLKKQKDDVVELCNKSIKSVNDRLAWVDTKKSYPNEYQRVRLKAFRTKCKEILRLLGECNE